jgi:phospholipid transport system substrate-binding protein
MAKLVLGRTHWPKLSVPQQKRFTELFAVRLKNFYLDKTSLYQDEKVFFKPAIQMRTGIQIPMTLISNEKEVSILYKLHKTADCWKIFDVEIEGISILMTYRSQFDDMLRKGSVQTLLSELEKSAAP